MGFCNLTGLNPWFNFENPINMSCWYMYEDTVVVCMTAMYLWLTNTGSSWIISIYIGHSAGIAGIIRDLWNMKSILVTNLFWVTWSPSVSRWRVPFCFTVESYTLFYTNHILRLKINNLWWICTSNWKIKNKIKKQHQHKYTSEWLAFNSYCKGPTLPVHLYTRGWCFFHLCGVFEKRSLNF